MQEIWIACPVAGSRISMTKWHVAPLRYWYLAAKNNVRPITSMHPATPKISQGLECRQSDSVIFGFLFILFQSIQCSSGPHSPSLSSYTHVRYVFFKKAEAERFIIPWAAMRVAFSLIWNVENNTFAVQFCATSIIHRQLPKQTAHMMSLSLGFMLRYTTISIYGHLENYLPIVDNICNVPRSSIAITA